ncbi:MAG: hypothetical protein U0905_16305 [Pirellulales bacterium]
MNKIFTALAFAGSLVLGGLPALAQSEKPGPKEPKFVVGINLQTAKQSSIGKLLFETVKSKALEEMQKKSGSDSADLDRLKEMIGFDPFEEVQSISFSSSDYEKPEESMIATIRLRKTTGNIEGLLLNLPEYKSEEYKSHSIHSVAPDSNLRVYGAIHGKGNQDRTIVLCPKADKVKQALDQLDASPSSEKKDDAIVKLRVVELPTDKLGEGPQANVAKIVKEVEATIRESNDQLQVALTMLTSSEKQAEQLRQMAQGLIAMIDFAQGLEPDDEDLKKVQAVLKGVEAKCNGNRVEVVVRVDSSEVAKVIEKEIRD